MASLENDKNKSVWPRRFEVSVERNQVERFIKSVSRQAALLDELELSVPTTFAASWLALPDIKAALLEATGHSFDEKKNALLHLEQTIEMIGKLQAGKYYYLDVEVIAPKPDDGFDVSAAVYNLDNELQVRLRSKFIILPMKFSDHE